LQLWKNAGVTPFGDWDLDVGQAMGATLTITDEKNAYCLADRGTWLAHQKHLDLKVLFSGDSSLHNPYGVIPVNPARHPHVHYVEAMAFTGWLTSPEGQKLIRDFRIGDQALFIPLAIQNPGDSH
jgi:tungstate transport system substrate-binding protein